MVHVRQLVVSVDTEEEGLWGGGYRASGNTTENLAGLPHFQSTCEQLSVPPTYLIDAPVLDNPVAMNHLRRWQEAGLCEVGSHCHPWCNPPLGLAPSQTAETFLCNLPAEVQHQKLQWLTEQIAELVQRQPTSYRAGRYGFDQTTAAILRDLGYQVDSSVLPLHEYRRQGGPDFQLSRRDPHLLFDDGRERNLLEIPVAAGFTRPGYARRRGLWLRLRQPPWSAFRSAGLADRFGIARRVKLTPEGTTQSDLLGLVDACVADGVETLVLMLHSSSLVSGLSPYARDSEMLEQLYGRLKRTVQHCTATHGFQGVTLTAAADSLLLESPRIHSLPFSVNS